MRLNQRGDALTLAMGAAVLVAVSVMAMVGVVSTLDAKTRRARLLNEIDSLELSLKQVLSSRDLCTDALRNASGNPVGFNVPNPNNNEWSRDIPRIYLGTSNTILACRSSDNNANCPDQQNARLEIKGIIQSMRFVMENTAANNRTIDYRGNKTGRYRLYSGRLEVSFNRRMTENNAAYISRIFGGDFAPRDFGLHLVVDTNNDSVVTCYSTASPAQICAQLSGRFDTATGACVNILGTCDPNAPNPLDRPRSTPNCPSNPGGTYSCRGPGGELGWRELYVADGFDSNMQLRCTCTKICVPTSDPNY